MQDFHTNITQCSFWAFMVSLGGGQL